MKRNFTLCAVLAAAMLLIPLTGIREKAEEPVINVSTQDDYDGFISVMKTDDGVIEEIPEREYLIGALAAEADMSHHDEALKAQCVACYTYALYTKGSKENGEADISDNTKEHQGYLSKSERQKKWGDNFSKYEEKATDIVESVLGEAIYYEDKPIMAVYHALNSGTTQSAQTVWKKSYPYLVKVESPGDKLAVDYTEKVGFTYEDFKEKITKIDGVTLGEDEEKWIGQIEKNPSGYVLGIYIGGNEVAAADVRTALELRSCCFDVDTSEDEITFETYGYGHLVGMSQYGADYMARQGSDYREILTYYYPNTKIK